MAILATPLTKGQLVNCSREQGQRSPSSPPSTLAWPAPFIPAGAEIAPTAQAQLGSFLPHSYFGNRNSDVWVEEGQPRAWRQEGQRRGPAAQRP